MKLAKDKIIGALVMIIGVLILIIYTMGSVVDLWFDTLGANPNWDVPFRLFGVDWLDWRLFTVLPLWIIVILIAVIAIWIGYSMLTWIAHFAIPEHNSCTRSIGRVRGRISCWRSRIKWIIKSKYFFIFFIQLSNYLINVLRSFYTQIKI